MKLTAFDTHAAIKKLQAAGFTEQQAEAQASLLAEVLESNLATKHDIEELRRDIKALETAIRRDIKELETATQRDIKELEIATQRDIKALEIKLDTKLAELKAELLKWIIGLLLAQTGLIAALVKLL